MCSVRKPTFKISAQSNDITSFIARSLIEIRLEDRSGDYSDALEVELADTGELAFPPEGAEMSAEIGYEGEELRRRRKSFAIDQIAHEGPPAALKISATSANFTSQARAPRERSFDAKLEDGTPRTFRMLMDEIASEHGYSTFYLPDALGDIELPHTDQAGVSDLGLAAETAELYGAMFKPVDGKWVFMHYAALAEQAPAAVIRPADVSRWRAHFVARRRYQSVVAFWHDFNQAKRTKAVAGDGLPQQVLNRTFVNAATAQAAADSALARGQRQARRLSLELPGRPDLASQQLIRLEGFRERVDDLWLIRRVSHVLNKRGYRSRIECEGV
jgi:phage protein D